MKILLTLIFVNVVLSLPYNDQRGRHNYGYGSQLQSQSISQKPCCTTKATLSEWAMSHIDDVRQVANIMKQEYAILSQGKSSSYTTYTYPVYGGKSQEEMHFHCQQFVRRVIDDVKSHRITQQHISVPNFFEQQASVLLEMLEKSENLQQQTQDIFGGDFIGGDIPTFETHATGTHVVNSENPVIVGTNTEIINKMDGTTHVSYPTEVRTINGRTFVVKKNCTTTTTTDGGMIPVYGDLSTHSLHQFNKTDNIYPGPTYIGQGQNVYYRENTDMNRQQPNIIPTYIPAGESRVFQHGLFHRTNNENFAPNYSPTTYLNEKTIEEMNRRHFQPQVVIPVPEYTMNEDVESFNKHNIGNQVYYPGGGHQKVTITKFNKTVITGPDGRPIINGGESKTVIDDGKVVYDHFRPFGSVPINWTMEESLEMEEEWKKDERERLFWLFQQGSINSENFERWQREQEHRLHDLSFKWNTTVDIIEEWQKSELDRYLLLNQQQNLMTSNLNEWQQKEKVRFDWLVHQNSLTREQLDKWQRENQYRLSDLAKQYKITIEELKDWQRKELEKLSIVFNQHNTELDELHQWQNQEKIRLNHIILQHNLTVEELKESIRTDLDRLHTFSQDLRGNVVEMEKWLKSETSRLTDIITEQQEEIKRLNQWQIKERDRLAMIVLQHNFTVEELQQRVKHDEEFIKNLARNYQVTIEELQEWQKKEIIRLQNLGTITFDNELKEWQQRERDRFMKIVKENDLTIEEFTRMIQEDRNQLNKLAQQYHTQVEEILEYRMKEANRLEAEGLIRKVEEHLNEWQQNERNRLLNIVQKNYLTIEELEKILYNDRNRLYNIAQQNQIQISEIEEWMRMEFHKLQEQGLVKIEDLKEWQKILRDQIQQIVTQNKLTIEEFEQQIQLDRNRLLNLANQYHIDITEIEEFIYEETDRIKSQGLIIDELNEWQQKERNRLNVLVHHNTLTIEDLERELKDNHERLLHLAMQFNIRIEEIENWDRKEFQRLQTLGLVKELAAWEKIELERLKQNIQQNSITIEEFERKFITDRNRLQEIARKYHITIEEVDEFMRYAIQRFKAAGLIKESEEQLTQWQKSERDYWLGVVQKTHMTMEEFEQRVREENHRLNMVAWENKISVDEIKEWIHKEADRLMKLNLIYKEELISEWQKNEREYIQQLLQSHFYSIEELERKLRNDREHLQIIASQYQITLYQIEEWYKKELERLQTQGKIISEQLKEWQRIEKNRIYQLVRQQNLAIDELERELWTNQQLMQNLADQYRITIDDLIQWQKTEMMRLIQLNLIQNRKLNSLNWQKIEQARLLEIANKFKISLFEFEDHLKSDHVFQQNLIKIYEINIEELKEFQKNELNRLQLEGTLDLTELIDLKYWQKRERDRLYGMIPYQNSSSLKELERWQEGQNFNETVSSYEISIDELKKWQKDELRRLHQLARYNKMTIKELELFRREELQRLNMYAHVSSNSTLYREWDRTEQQRSVKLAEKYGISLYSLKDFRRKLFLLCQGYLKFNFKDLIDLGNSSRNITISKDRGDQPPKVEVDYYDEFEPEIGFYNVSLPQTNPAPTFKPYITPLAPMQIIPAERTQYERTYKHKETSYMIPAATVVHQNSRHEGYQYTNARNPHSSFASASASSSPVGGSHSSATVFNNGYDYQQDDDQQRQKQIFDEIELENLKLDNNDQQIVQKENLEDLGQVVQNENFEDLGQIVQKENYEDLGQIVQKEKYYDFSANNHQQVENDKYVHGSKLVSNENSNQYNLQQHHTSVQSKNDTTATGRIQEIVEADPVQEGVWSKFKNKVFG